MKIIYSIIACALLSVSAFAQTPTPPPTPDSPTSFLDGLSLTNINVVAYGTHFDANNRWGGGFLALYKFNGYVSAGLGSDWAGEWRFFNGTVTIHKDWQLLPKLSVRTYGLVAAGTSIGGAGSDNGTLASGEGGGVHFTYQLNDKWNAGVGGGYMFRQNCGSFSGGSEMGTFSVGFNF